MNRVGTEKLPDILRPTVEQRLAVLGGSVDGASPDLRDALPRVLAASPFVADVLTRDSERFARFASGGWFELQEKPGVIASRVTAAVAQCETDEAFMRALRNVRTQEMARIAFRDIAGWAALDETLGSLSELADAAIQAALDHAGKLLQGRHGAPRGEGDCAIRPYVIGMGKLGGRELNFSSDIDLILGYDGPGETAGEQKISNEEYFGKLVQRFTRLLSERTADGFVFRVDWMLRPFGASGPPAMHSEAMEEYYLVHGREWERYAFIKARIVAGDRKAGQRLLADLQPFVYRRYLDFNAVGALRDLKRKIAEDVQRRDLHDNLKLGSGGIRELEFIAQAFQLVRGGQEKALRDNRFRKVLARLGRTGQLPSDTARALDEAYVFLRRVENAVQMYGDEQTHELPESAEARAALCVALGLESWDGLQSQLQAVRERVQEEFGRVFAEPRTPARKEGAGAVVAQLWSGTLRPEEARALVQQLRFTTDPDAVVEALSTVRESHLVRTLSESSQRRLESLVILLVTESLKEKAPETVLRRVLGVVHAIAGRATYLTLLRESDVARAQLIRLCAASPWITDFIAQFPALLDHLLDVRALYAPPDHEQIRAELEEFFSNVPSGDTEAAMDALRRFQQEITLRVAAADLLEALPLVKVSDRLTWLAESIVEKTLALTRAELEEQYGRALRADGEPVGFAVIAYGKFGGIEMGYGSDLDVIFLHDCDDLQRETHGGKRPLANETWLARMAQKIIHWISTQTGAGRAYALDLELRPDGRRGLTVNSIAGFERYQSQDAWTWEHQALSRARPVAGDERIRREFSRIRRSVLTRARDPAKLRQDVVDMRRRMRKHRDRTTKERFDVKQGEGGLTDIEFITQYLVLRHAHEHPALIEWPDNWRQTDALVAAGVVSAGQARALIDTYRSYRAWLHAQDLQQAGHLAEDSLFRAERRAVRDLWREFLHEGA